MKARHRVAKDELTDAADAAGPWASSGSVQEGIADTSVNEPDCVSGDRGIPSVNRARSLQSRVSNALAMGMMAALGLGLMSWYYVQAFARQSKVQDNAQSSARAKVQGEMVLPALGRVDPPRVAPSVVEQVLGPAPQLPEDWPPSVETERFTAASGGYSSAVAGSTKSLEELAHERRLGGAAFVAVSSSGRGAHVAGEQAFGETPGASSVTGTSERAGRGAGDLADYLQPTATPAALASVLPTQRMLLAKGSFVDCTLETALDSTLPGMATCVTATDTFGVDGKVVLLERGTKLVGETRGSVRQGAARIFVLWTHARTPDGVIVPLASPGTDELGRAGLPGEVDRHFFERFGAATLISLIDGAIQGAVQSSTDGSTVIFNPSTSQDILTEVLRSTVNIPPTVRKRQGDRIQVLVARDLDFRSVYRLRAAVSEEDIR